MNRNIILKDVKVIRKFGYSNLERGLFLPMSKTVTVGIRWNLRKLIQEPDTDVKVNYMFTLKRIGKNLFKLNCDEKVFEKCMFWLLETCGT